ncbi:hypothetical protein [Niastella caeni]|nr:hypothetical protein [Niastella caeni]
MATTSGVYSLYNNATGFYNTAVVVSLVKAVQELNKEAASQ